MVQHAYDVLKTKKDPTPAERQREEEKAQRRANAPPRDPTRSSGSSSSSSSSGAGPSARGRGATGADHRHTHRDYGARGTHGTRTSGGGSGGAYGGYGAGKGPTSSSSSSSSHTSGGAYGERGAGSGRPRTFTSKRDGPGVHGYRTSASSSSSSSAAGGAAGPGVPRTSNGPYRSRPTPTPDMKYSKENCNPDDIKRAEEALRSFWSTGKFPFEFCRTAPSTAADLFARMLQESPDLHKAWGKVFGDGHTAGDYAAASASASAPSSTSSSTSSSSSSSASSATGRRGSRSGADGSGGSMGGADGPPRRVSPPRMSENTSDSVTVEWDAPEGGGGNGRPVLAYELQWRVGARAGEMRPPATSGWCSASKSLTSTACRKKNLRPGRR